MMELVKIEQLSKQYGSKHALRNIDANITLGKIIGVVGSNGSGKTTLLKLIAGQLHASSGQITIDGKEVDRTTKNIVSFMPDGPFLDKWMKIEDALFFYRDFFPDFDIRKAVDMLASMKISQEEKISSLSKGTLEKVQLILTLARNVKLYVLDEPLGGIDPVARAHILDLILDFYHEGCTILISTHLIQEIEKIFDEVMIIKDGELLLHENVEDLRFREGKAVDELFKEVFGTW
ncbi:ABC transporter ATP-binding protein [Microbacteriaceae bacterium 4G12]